MQQQLMYLIFGMIAVWISAGVVIDGSLRIAKALRISELFIGLTVISIGTSLPEIATHIVSSIDILKGMDASGVAVGTNIGSNLVQITLILGLVGFFTVVKSKKTVLRKDYLIMLASIVLLWILSLNHYIGRLEGITLAGLYIYYLVRLSKKEKVIAKANHVEKLEILSFFSVLLGLAALIYSANLVVDNAVQLANIWHVTGSFIGALMIGVATALPELTTALRGIFKGAESLSLGTLIGSNITNPLFALGIGAAISGYKIDNGILWIDLPYWFFASLLVLYFFGDDFKLDKKESIALIFVYIAYVLIRISLS